MNITKIRDGYFAKYKNRILKMWYHRSKVWYQEDGWEINSSDLTLLNEGFYKREEGYCYKSVGENKNISAYEVRNYCTYKGVKCGINNYVNNKFIIYLLSTKDVNFDDLPPMWQDYTFEADDSDINDIWEEREPIDGFIFDVEPIVYIKKDGKYLDSVLNEGEEYN